MVVKANIVKNQTIGVDLNQKAGGFNAPVQSVNNKTGDVVLDANDVGAVSKDEFQATTIALEELTTRLNELADSDDTTLDQMSELVAYIKANRGLIEGITTNKVNVTDIINDLTTNAADKPLSAAQGVALKTLIDKLELNKLNASSLTSAINTALAQAKESGEFDGADGVGISSLEQAIKATASGGDNVWRARTTDGHLHDFYVKNGEKGEKGESGSNGVGISYVEQEYTSLEDGGRNIINVVRTDGHFDQFYVRNGSKGSTGDPGEKGDPGKTAYEYAQDGGFTGTEEDFTDLLIKHSEAYEVDKFDTLVWNGDRDGRIAVKARLSESPCFVHVSYDTPTLEDFANGWDFEMSRIPEGGEKADFERELKDVGNGVLGQSLSSIFYVVPEDNTFAAEIVFPKKGIYFHDDIFRPARTKSLTITGYEFTETALINEYLPKHEHSWEDVGQIEHPSGSSTITSDDFVYGGFHKVCDVVPTATIVKRGGEITYYANGALNTATHGSGDWAYTEYAGVGIHITYNGLPVVVISYVPNPEFGALSLDGVTERGVYFLQTDSMLVHSLAFKGYEGCPTTEIVPLPNKYLKLIETVDPDTLAWDGDTEGMYAAYYKRDTEPHYLMSEATPSIDLFDNAKLTYSDGTVLTKESMGDSYAVDMYGDGTVYQVLQHVIVAYSDCQKVYQDSETGAYVTDRFKKGVYFKNDGTNYVTSFKITGYTEFGVEKVKEKYLPENTGGGGGGVSSWNDLTDKPFYETTTGEDIITWDGNKTGLPNVSGMFYLKSSVVPTIEDLANGGTLVYQGVEETFTGDGISNITDTLLMVKVDSNPRAVIAICDNAVAADDSIIPNKGVYLLHSGASTQYVSSFAVNGFSFKETEIKTIDPKFLPPVGVSSWNDLTDRPFGETTVTGDTLTWDGNTEGLESFGGAYYKLTDTVPSMTDLENGGSLGFTVDSSGEILTLDLNATGDDTVIISEPAEGLILIAVDATGLFFLVGNEMEDPDVGVIAKGTYAYKVDNVCGRTLTINNYNGFETTETVPLPNKYLDIIETVGGDTLTWDGNTSGLESADVAGDGSLYYRVTDVYPTIQEAQNGGIVHTNDVELGDLWVNAIDMTEQFGVECYLLAAANGVPVAVCVSQNVTIEGYEDLYKGIYLEPTARSLTINGYTGFTKEQVKQEYLPSGGTFFMDSSGVDEYLYLDSARTTKATMADVDKAVSKGGIVINSDGMYHTIVSVYPAATVEEGKTGYILCAAFANPTDLSLMVLPLYTAEYTS